MNQDQTSIAETIFALSSGAMPSGVGVIRITGPKSAVALQVIAGVVPRPRVARLLDLRDAQGDLIDRGICLYFKAPASFTGEDSAEFQVHGGKAVINKIQKTLMAMPGFREAEAGEFTRRAYLNGKLDLANAEALSDLISAETEAQRRFAISNASDKHNELYARWRGRLIKARALIEAELDFADEGDVPAAVFNRVREDIAGLYGEIHHHASGYHNAEIIREGLNVVLVGAPNAGKSSLMNALAKRDVSIVTEDAGTTRDVIVVHLDIDGLKVNLADTAGIRDAETKAEAIGINRSLERARTADLVLYIEDMTRRTPFALTTDKPVIKIANKADLAPALPRSGFDCVVSAITGEGLDALFNLIRSHCAAYLAQSTSLIPFRDRHRTLLELAANEIKLSLGEQDLELAAERLRLASDATGRICGNIDVEDLLDSIFASFCIGK